MRLTESLIERLSERLPKTLMGLAKLGAASLLLLFLASVRHHFFWGEPYESLLHVFEWSCLIASQACLCVCLMAGLRILDTSTLSEADKLRLVFKSGMLLALAALFVLPFLSEDIISYIGRGRILGVHGMNPYTTLASALQVEDPALVRDMKAWADHPLPYGPLLAILQAAIAIIADLFASLLSSKALLWLGIFLFKIPTILCFLLSGRILAWLAEELREGSGARVLLCYLWNPFLLLEVCVNGHNDIYLFLPLIAGLLAAQRGQHGRAMLWLFVSAQCKFTSILLCPLLLVLAWRKGKLETSMLATGIGIASFGLMYLLFWSEPGAMGFLSKQEGITGLSLQRLAVQAIGSEARPAIMCFGRIATLLVVGHAMLRLRTANDLPRLCMQVLVVLIVIGLPIASPWYAIWWAGLAILATQPYTTSLLLLSITIAPSYSIYLLNGRDLGDEHQLLQWSLAILVPILPLLYRALRVKANASAIGQETGNSQPH